MDFLRSWYYYLGLHVVGEVHSRTEGQGWGGTALEWALWEDSHVVFLRLRGWPVVSIAYLNCSTRVSYDSIGNQRRTT